MIECISAPIADCENDSISDNEKSNTESINQTKIRRSYSDPMDISLESTISSSLEDLISTFDEKIYKCFQDLGADTTKIAPVSIKNELLIEKSEWWKMASIDEPERRNNDFSLKKHDNGQHINDESRLIYALSGNDSPSLRSTEGLLLEIHEMMDYSDNNADFEGIEESFYDSDLSESTKDAVVNFQCVWSNKEGTDEWQKALECLSVEALKMLHNDMKARVRTLSDCLLIHLQCRDELEFEREVRDRFMLLLQGVQRKKREFARSLVTQRQNAVQLRQRNRTASRWSWNGNWGTMFGNQKMLVIDPDQLSRQYNGNQNDDNNNSTDGNDHKVSKNVAKDLKGSTLVFSDGSNNSRSSANKTSKGRVDSKSQMLDATLKYLSTTIPFNPGVSSFNVQHLQIFNKILLAILQENSKLDNFLTEYILNVYTPSVDNNSVFVAPDNCNNYQIDTICQ